MEDSTLNGFDRLRREGRLIDYSVGALREQLTQGDQVDQVDPVAILIAETIQEIDETPIAEYRDETYFQEVIDSPDRLKQLLNRLSSLFAKLNFMETLAETPAAAEQSVRGVADSVRHEKRYVSSLRQGVSSVRDLVAYLKRLIQVILADILQIAQGIYSMRTLVEWSLSFGLAGALQATLTFSE